MQGTKLHATISGDEKVEGVWLYREANSLEELKKNVTAIPTRLYFYGGNEEPYKGYGSSVFWNAKKLSLWKNLMLSFDAAQLNITENRKRYRFYYLFESYIDGLNFVFTAKARPDGQWKTAQADLTLSATCSSSFDDTIGHPISAEAGHDTPLSRVSTHSKSLKRRFIAELAESDDKPDEDCKVKRRRLSIQEPSPLRLDDADANFELEFDAMWATLENEPHVD